MGGTTGAGESRARACNRKDISKVRLRQRVIHAPCEELVLGEHDHETLHLILALLQIVPGLQ